MITVNAVIYLAIILRLMFFDKSGMKYKPGVSILAYCIIISAGYVMVNSLYGIYEPPHAWEVILNLLFMIVVFKSGGNLSTAMKGARA